MVSHDWVAQTIRGIKEGVDVPEDPDDLYKFLMQPISSEDKDVHDDEVRCVLLELLKSGIVEIGYTTKTRADKVDFVAWKGAPEIRAERALNKINDALHLNEDASYAYWLCLRENVDRYED